MQNSLHKIIARVLRILPAQLLAALLLFGCARSVQSGNDLIDEDSLSDSSAATVQVETISSENTPKTIDLQSIETLLPDSTDFAVLFVNVGKADACILRFGETAVLIDTGSAESVPQLIAGLNALKITNIGAVFITHSHSDHLGGLDALAANYDIPVVYSPYYSEADKDGNGKIVKRAEKLDLPHKELKAGDVIEVANGASFTVLGPLSLNKENDNDNSLVLKLTYGEKTFLFTGDMQFTEEQALIDSGVSLGSDILKVGNHGNPDATSDAFGALVSPAIAVISTDTSVDEDSANPRVLAALSTANIYVTQDFPIGVLLTLDSNGNPVLSNPAKPGIVSNVVVDSIDVKNQSVTLFNRSDSDVDLSGYILYSARTDATLRFPNGSIIPANGTIVIGDGNALVFPGEDKPLSKKKDNSVQLFAPLGALISELDE